MRRYERLSYKFDFRISREFASSRDSVLAFVAVLTRLCFLEHYALWGRLLTLAMRRILDDLEANRKSRRTAWATLQRLRKFLEAHGTRIATPDDRNFETEGEAIESWTPTNDRGPKRRYAELDQGCLSVPRRHAG
jgi:hypothetical protein